MPNYSRQHAAAFVEFAKGQSLEEIAFGLGVPLELIKGWHRTEAWATVATQALVPVSKGVELAKRDNEAIQVNRNKNLLIAQRLQEDLLEVVGKLRDGSLTLEKVTGKGMRLEVKPGIRDRADLANYARTVADMSYRALGDVIEVKHSGTERPDNPGAGQITIVLPAMVSAPRQERPELSLNIDSKAVMQADTFLADASDSGPSDTPSVGS